MSLPKVFYEAQVLHIAGRYYYTLTTSTKGSTYTSQR